MNEKISEELIRIIKSHSNCSSLVSNLMHLLNSGILNSEENSLCSEILDQIELFNTFDLDKISCVNVYRLQFTIESKEETKKIIIYRPP